MKERRITTEAADTGREGRDGGGASVVVVVCGGGGRGGGREGVELCACLASSHRMMQLIRGSQTPQDKSRASAPPDLRPDDGGTRPCACAHGPKKSTPQLINLGAKPLRTPCR